MVKEAFPSLITATGAPGVGPRHAGAGVLVAPRAEAATETQPSFCQPLVTQPARCFRGHESRENSRAGFGAPRGWRLGTGARAPVRLPLGREVERAGPRDRQRLVPGVPSEAVQGRALAVDVAGCACVGACLRDGVGDARVSLNRFSTLFVKAHRANGLVGPRASLCFTTW